MNGETALVVAAVVVGIVAVMFGRRVRQRRAKPGVDPLVHNVPRFRVVTLGLQGSGKTLLLTSIYRRLQTPGDRGYYIRAPHPQLIELTKWYREAADAGLGWPKGTRSDQMREFEFSVMSHVDDTAQTLLKIGYLEYPGELLTDADQPGSTAQDRLLTSIDKADALIGIIDGLRLLQAYRGERRGEVLLMTTIDAMINSMLAARCPISFVITKWDLLDELHPDENTRLHIVRTLLMGIEGFRDLVKVHSSRRVIRLVPVTAVGHDFAVLRDGKVEKKPAGRFQPANVDLALATVVPDILHQIELSLDRATREAVLAEAHRRLRMGPGEALRSLGSFLTEKAGRVLLTTVGGGLLGDAGMALFLDSRVDTREGMAQAAQLSAADRRAEQFVQARRRVVYELQRQVTMLEARLPSSRLGSEF